MEKVFIEHLKDVNLELLEEFSEDWLKIGGETKDIVYPYIIKEKLNRYESEY